MMSKLHRGSEICGQQSGQKASHCGPSVEEVD